MSVWFETSPAGYDLIKRFEGCKLTAYKKGADPWTVGWGITGHMPDGRPVVEGLTITQREADEALEWFVRNVSDPLTRKHFNARTQSEFDALSSWVYNLNHSKLERGEYSLPRLINMRDRDMNALIGKWVEYVNPRTIFEQGLYRRRLAEVCVFLGLPWHFALSASLKRINGIVADRTDPFYIIELAEAARDAAKPIPSEPDPPKAPKPVAPVETKPLPEVAKTTPVAGPVGTKAPSPKTVKPEDVPYRIDPNAGLKPLEESDRAKGYFFQQLAVLFLRLTGLGTFGTGAAQVANIVQSDAALSGAIFNLTIPALVLVTGLATSFAIRSYGDWKRKRGEEAAVQGLY